MSSPLVRRRAARYVFILGLLGLLLGSAFLLGTMEGASRISVMAAFFFVLLGSLSAILAIKLHKRSLYLFFAGFFILLGLFLLFSALNIIPVSLRQGWPLLSVFSGLALVPAGWHRYGGFRIRYVVPAIAFVLLGSVLLVFSFNIVPFSFAQFVIRWWPLLIVLTGLLLILLSLASEASTPRKPPDEKPDKETG
ncbi:MAG: hypothetical protein LBG90_01500 [Spirochaetaceae bacterium]|jgi:hypothetical protein|nr:hypothetical protein [Spirochaetaceae bacterium]